MVHVENITPSKTVQDALRIISNVLEAVDPHPAILKAMHLENDTLSVETSSISHSFDFDRIFVIGFGKASARMAQAVEDVFRDKFSNGHINTKYGHAIPLEKTKTTEAGHPVPDESGVEGTRKIVQIAEQAGKHDIVVCLISGGGSALLVHPATGISLTDLQTCNQALLACGATIHEMNAVRKHLSSVKGGLLAPICAPATMINLIVSDVIGDPLDVIASGPTVPDESTFTEAIQVIDKFEIRDSLPVSVIEYLCDGKEGRFPETPKMDDPAFRTTYNHILCNNDLAVRACADTAKSLGYVNHLFDSKLQGEARFAADRFVKMIKDRSVEPSCHIAGGETTVTIRGTGKGGRNQEMALAFLIGCLKNDIKQDFLFASIGTDGTDGPTDASGAVVTPTILETCRKMKLNPEAFLENNDSYHFFKETGGLLMTGPTQTNVMDIQILILP